MLNKASLSRAVPEQVTLAGGRNSKVLAATVPVTDVAALNPGDLVFFPGHVGLWLGEQELLRGTLTQPSVYPREVVKSALARNAAAMILAHNHPSGDPTPSADDIALIVPHQARRNCFVPSSPGSSDETKRLRRLSITCWSVARSARIGLIFAPSGAASGKPTTNPVVSATLSRACQGRGTNYLRFFKYFASGLPTTKPPSARRVCGIFS